MNLFGVTVVIARTDFTDILSLVANWPVEDRIVLKRWARLLIVELDDQQMKSFNC